jgi:predicted PurR-regulated permease PerM
VRAASLVIIAIVAAAGGLYFARDLLIPVALALLFAAVLRPLVRALARIKIPPAASATLIVLAILGVLGIGVSLLSQPVQNWVKDAPKTLAAARAKLDKIRRPVQRVSQAMEQAQEEVVGGDRPGQSQAPAPAAGPQAPSFLARVFGTTASFLSGFFETLVLVFLLLATGDLFRSKVAALMPRPAEGTAEETVDAAEGVVRHYLVVTALINLGQGAAVGVVMQLIGLPNPVLWGLLTFALEFLPYLGGALMMVLLTIAAFATFEGIGHILLAPGAYLAITTIQNNVISPFAYGYRLQLNPVVVLLGTLAGWFLWGTPGAFMAIPVLAAVKVIEDHTKPDSRLAVALGE